MAVIQKCDFNSLNAAGRCYACLTERQNQAVIAYFLSTRLAQLSGLPVISPNTLRTQAKAIFTGTVEQTADNLDAAVAQGGAIAAGVPGAATMTIAQIVKNSLMFANMGVSEIRAIEILLRCQLNNFP